MIYSEILKNGSNVLKKNKIKNPYLDTELILSKVTNKKREDILLNLSNKLKNKEIKLSGSKTLDSKKTGGFLNRTSAPPDLKRKSGKLFND